MNLENSNSLSSLEKMALEWVKSEFNDAQIKFSKVYSKNSNGKSILILINSKKYFLIIRLKRDFSYTKSESPRNKEAIEREVIAYNSCNFCAPKMVRHNTNLGALLYESINEDYVDTVTLLRGLDGSKLLSFLKPAITSLDQIHNLSFAHHKIFTLYEDTTYEYINYYAKKMKPGITLPDFKDKKCLLHGNTNPGNWIQHGGKGYWLDFEDSHVGMSEFDFGYLLGHLRIIKSNSILDGYLALLSTCGLCLDSDLIIEISRVVAYYIIETESIYNRYPFCNFNELNEYVY